MAENSSRTTVLSQDDIAALREELTQIALILAQHYDAGAPVEAQLYQRLPALRERLARFEQELAALALERGELAALYGISQAIGSSLDLAEVLNEVMDQIIRLTGAERAFLMLVDPETGELEFRAARNMDRETITASSFEISRSIVKQVATSGEPIVTTNAQMDPRFKAQESVIGYNLRSILCAPLRAHGRVTGVIYADNRIRAGLFSDRDRDLLTTFAGQAAVRIENARLFERIADAKVLRDNIFASITSGVITTDVQDRIILFNRAAKSILQMPATTIVGSRFADALPALESELRPLVEEVKIHGEPVVG
ncbi:MAG: GAF domain-containing protein, partial [Anaerolineae bacterium]|nr:GAF domain-containing protein [Anaerolineae bacterium]